jgi:hypothetical protein
MNRAELQEIATEHYEASQTLRSLAAIRVNIIRELAAAAQRQYEEDRIDFETLTATLEAVIDPDALDKLARTIERSIKLEREALGMDYLDLSKAVGRVSAAGYALISKTELKRIRDADTVQLSESALSQIK